VDALPIFLASPRLECRNNECVGAEPKGTFDDEGNLLDENGNVATTKRSKRTKWNRNVQKGKGHSFILASDRAFLQYPDDVKGLCASHCYGLATDDAPQIHAAPKLAQDVLDTSKTISAMAQTLENHFSVMCETTAHEHQIFVKVHGKESQPSKT
jgi:hypothetical protein